MARFIERDDVGAHGVRPVVTRIPTFQKVRRLWAHAVRPYITVFCLVLLAQTPSRAQNLDALLAAPQQAPFQWFASTDAKHQNHDYLELKPNETRRIPLTKGKLLRLWFTNSNPQKCDVSLQNGAQKIVLLQNGKTQFGELFGKAWLCYPTQTLKSQAILSTQFAQLWPNAALIVTNRDKDILKFFYQAAIGDSARKSRAVAGGKTMQLVSEWRLQPGASHDFVVNGGNGVVEKIAISYDASDLRGGNSLSDNEVLNGVRLQAAWDGEKQLAVDASLAQLAGGWSDANALASAIATPAKNSFTLLWPMPLPAKRVISLHNSSKSGISFYISTTIRNGAVPSTRFHARFGSETTTPGKPIQIVRVQGKGKLVGLNLDMRPIAGSTRRTFAFLEGNEIIKTDDRVLEGTGNEDFFNSAWYFPDKPFARDFYGLTRKTPMPPGVTAFRWLLPDAIPFQKTLDFQFGHSGTNTTNNMEFRWVAFWYADAKSRFQIEDKLAQKSADSSDSKETPKADKSLFYLGLVVLFGGALAAFQIKLRRKRIP